MNLRFGALVCGSVIFLGCGPTVVRGSDDPSVDRAALSTGLDKDDIKRALERTLNQMRTSSVMNEWRTTNPKPNVAILPFKNNTTEHIDSMLDAMLSDAEGWLVESEVVNVIAHDQQKRMIGEVRYQQSVDFDPSQAAQLGKQMGVKYFITGKVQAADERGSDMRRVQYILHLQVIEAETSLLKFQKDAEITKAIK